MMLRATQVSLWGLVFILGGAADAPNPEGVPWQRIQIPRHGAIELPAPLAWRLEARNPGEKPALTFEFSPQRASKGRSNRSGNRRHCVIGSSSM